MSTQSKVQLTPESQRIIANLKSMPQRMGVVVAKAMDDENEKTVAHISERYLSRRGANTLGVRTNRLRSSLRRTPARISGDLGVSSSIGTNVEYAGVHEFGFKGTVTIKSHARKMTSAFGIPLSTPVTVNVRTHTRNVDIKKRAPIQSGIADRLDSYVRSISKAIVATAD